MSVHQLLKAIADEADDTGCDGCFVVSAEHIRAAVAYLKDHPEPLPPRILVHLDSGAIHNIASTVPGLEVLIKDDDVEGSDPERIRTAPDGECFFASFGPWEVNPSLVEHYFAAAADPQHPSRVPETALVLVPADVVAHAASGLKDLANGWPVGQLSAPIDETIAALHAAIGYTEG